MCGQSIAYNIYATLGHTNPLFMGFLGYQNVNKEIIIRFWNVQFQKEFSTPQDFSSGEFLCIFLKENVIK